jgi:hypothetical protein
VKFSTLALLGALLFAVAPTFGQHPDFTGNWKHSQADSGAVYTVEQQGSLLNITFKSSYQAGSLGTALSWSGAYAIDGSEQYRKAANGAEVWTTVNWQGSYLVIQRVSKDAYRITVTREAWSLSNDGRALNITKRTVNMDGVKEEAADFHKL